jgi:glucokinase
MTDRYGLVGDIGGTHARFALTNLSAQGTLTESRRLLCADYPTVEDAVLSYLGGVSPEQRPQALVFAVAGPKIGDEIALTNAHWRISESRLRAAGPFAFARLINDYAALAFAAPHLGNDNESRAIGPAVPPKEDATVAILGAGTGLGVSALARDDRGQTPITCEGGHVTWAPLDDLEREISGILAKKFGRVSLERILSGPGLVCLHQALHAVHGKPMADITPAALAQQAHDGDADALATVKLFWGVTASFAGDAALLFGALGGVFIAGGVSRRLLDLVDVQDFRRRFEDKGRFDAYLRPIPTRAILDPDLAALQGSAAALRVYVGV